MITFNAKPLEKYSSLHTISLLTLLGIKSKFSPRFSFVLSFNLETPLEPNPPAQLTFHVGDSDKSSKNGNPDFCIAHLIRWRLNISQYSTFTSFLQKMKRKHYLRFTDTQKSFDNYGAKISLIEHDWSQFADTVYQLYSKVAKKHGTQLYDLNFFQSIAKNDGYKLLCVLYNDVLIGALVIVDEQPILHSMCCGLDYDHSKNSRAYSQMHYEFIRLAIESKKYTVADIGITANEAKSMLDFQPISVSMDVWAHNRFLRACLRFLSRFMTATINSKARLELSFHLPWKKR